MASSDEKHAEEYNHVDHKQHEIDDDISHGFTEAEQKSIIRRVDRRLVVTVGAMYCVSLMDRTNMSSANIAGMSPNSHFIKVLYTRTSS